MRYYITFIIIITSHCLLFGQVDWPFPNGDQQANVIGSIGEYRYSSSSNTHRFHKGIDLTDGTEYSIHAINSGTVTFVNGGNTWNAWTTYVRVGTVYYFHMKPKESIRNGTVTQVQAGDYLGELLTTNGIGPHLHLQENNTNYLQGNLNPYVDNSAPFFSSNYITNSVQFYQNGLIKTTANYTDLLFNNQVEIQGVLYTKLYNKIDIVTHVIDFRTGSNGGGAGGQIVPYEISWQLLNSENQSVVTDHLRFDAVPNNDAAPASFHPLSVHAGNPSIHIITSHPTQMPYDRYFNSNLRQTSTESWPNNTTLDASCINESRTPDGLYTMNINAFDVDYANTPNNVAPQQTINVLLDNFKPYLERVVVKRFYSEDIVYEGKWTWEGNKLKFSTSSPQNQANEGYTLEVFAYYSEPMINSEMSYAGKKETMTAVEDLNNKVWYCEMIGPPSGDVVLTFSKNSLDFAGNSLMGFSSTSSIGDAQIPKHQIDGGWLPASAGSDDIVHHFNVVPKSLSLPVVKASTDQTDKITVKVSSTGGGTHYKLFRNSINSATTAVAVTDWLSYNIDLNGDFGLYNDFNVSVGTDYYYWAKTANSSSGAQESIFSTSSIGQIYSPCNATFICMQQNYNIGAYQVDFQSSIEGNIVEYSWDFGDGYTSNEVNPTHYYSYSGDYIVSLKVKNSDGVNYTYTDNVKILRSGGGDIEVYLSSSTPGCFMGTPIVMYGEVINDVGIGPYTYNFDLGDGRIITVIDDWKSVFTENLTYSAVGEYIIGLTVTSSDGLTGYSSQEKIRVYDDDFPTMLSFDEMKITAEPCDIIPVGGTISLYNSTSPPEYVGHNMWWWNFGSSGGASEYQSYVPIVNHTYNSKGNKIVKVELAYSNGNTCLDCEIWKSINVVDCDETVTNDFSIATLDDWNNINRFWSGSFNLQNLADISSFNSKKIELSACNEIILNPGFESDPTSDNYLLLKANEPCLQGGNITTSSTKATSELITDIVSPKVKQLQEIRIYPNPTQGKINIEFPDIEQIDYFEVYNTLGQKIYIENNIQPVEVVDLTSGVEGLYVIKIMKADSNIEIHKIILFK